MDIDVPLYCYLSVLEHSSYIVTSQQRTSCLTDFFVQNGHRCNAILLTLTSAWTFQLYHDIVTEDIIVKHVTPSDLLRSITQTNGPFPITHR